jgi:MFS family permease
MTMKAAVRGRWAVAALFAINGFIMGALAPQFPLILPRYHITEKTLGLLILMYGVGAVGAMLFAGRLIARHGTRKMALLFAALATPTLPLVILAPNLYMAGFCMMAMGAMLGCMDVAMNANAIEVERRLGRAIMSSSHGFWSLGGFVGGSVGGIALERFGPEAQALAVGAIALVVLALSGRHLWHEPAAPVSAGGHVTFPRVPALFVLGALALFSMSSEGSVLDWAALYLTKEFDASVGKAGLAFSLFAGTMAVVRFLGDGVRNRFGAVRTLRVSGLVAALGIAIAAVAPFDTVAISGFALSGLGVANMVPILFSAAGKHPGIQPGSGIASVTMIGYSGILLAPSAIGLAAETIGYRSTYLTIAILLIVVAAAARRAEHADNP